MITREQLKEALNNENVLKLGKNIDHDVEVIMFLRKKIPYAHHRNIIKGARHDVLFLCSVDVVTEYLDEIDLILLTECNVWIDDDNDCLALFV